MLGATDHGRAGVAKLVEKRSLATAASRLLLATLAVCLACSAVPSGAPAPTSITTAEAAQSAKAKAKGRVIARKRLIASKGGRLRARNGVELRVSPRVMRRNGIARIRRLPRGQFDIHISAPWKGRVTVLLPLGNAKDPAVAHRVRGRWIVEPMTVIKGRARLRVRRLSVFDTNEQRRYALETMNLTYKEFIARKADFYTKNKCDNKWPEASGDPPTSEGCKKPWPYNSFDWTDDGCSPPTLKDWKDLFYEPCQQHDFGYRNFGKGLTLERNEDRRAWIDGRFKTEMKRLCDSNFSHQWQIINRQACFKEAEIIWAGVRHSSFVGNDWSKPLPAPASGPSTAPAPAPGPTERRVTVSNKVTNGATAMREDTPAYLSTLTRNYCKRDGCALAGTDMGTGAVITATCQTSGNRTTNGWDANPSDDSNPGLFSSTRWYNIRWSDGRTGWLSEVWLAPASRGGLGLRAC